MNHAVLVGFAGLLGLAVGRASGWLAVYLETRENLQAEEREERSQFEAEQTQAIAAAAAAGKPAPKSRPWISERYGWTLLERLVSPLLTGALFVLLAMHEPFGLGLLIHLWWFTVLIHIALFDIKHRLILNRITFPAIAISIALAPISPGLNLPRALIGAVIVYAFFMLQWLVVGDGFIGQGDAKLGALVGGMTGLSFDGSSLGAVYAIIVAVLLGGVTAVLLLATRIRGLKDPIPYGPFLCAGAAWILYIGPGLWR